MQCLVPLRIHPVLQRISYMNEIQCIRFKTSRNIVKQCIPDKPKKPSNPYILFMKDKQSELCSKHPDLSRPQLMQKAASMWRDADTIIRAQYASKYEAEKGKYAEEIESYKNNLTDEQKAAIVKFKEMTLKKKEKSQMKKALKDLGKPKRPPASFALYFGEKIVESAPGETVLDRTRRLSLEWKNLPELEKERYKTKAAELRKNYEQEMKKWESKGFEFMDKLKKGTSKGDTENQSKTTKSEENQPRTAKSKTLAVGGYVSSLFKKSKK